MNPHVLIIQLHYFVCLVFVKKFKFTRCLKIEQLSKLEYIFSAFKIIKIVLYNAKYTVLSQL